MVKPFELLETLEDWLLKIGLNDVLAHVLKLVLAIALMLLIAVVAYVLVKKVLVKAMGKISKRTKARFLTLLIGRKFFHRLSHVVPAIVIYATIGVTLGEAFPKTALFIQDICKIYLIITVLMIFNSFLNAVNDQYQTLQFSKSRPIKGYLQVLKIIVYFFCGIIVVAIVIHKDVSTLIVGLGASTAILMLVFKDSITGFVASIQLTANNMLQIGDWIEMPARNIDGNVIDINLTTVKVQNWDNTISTVPPMSLVSESYTNWRGMEESEGRRIKWNISIDVKTVRFCTPEMFDRFEQIGLVSDYVKHLREQKPIAGSVEPVAHNATNLNVFRHYIVQLLKAHPAINHSSTLIVRLLQPDHYGIPLEIYCFSGNKVWAQYEDIQSSIFDHVMAAVGHFDLKVYQRVSGSDFRDAVLMQARQTSRDENLNC